MEYIIQDSTLQGIADAIRAKAGTSDPITTSAFASAIAAIEAGGGGASFATGTYTAVEQIEASAVVIQHNLGVIPKKMFWITTAPDTSAYSGNKPFFTLYISESGFSRATSSSSSGSSLKGYITSNYAIDKIESTESTIKLSDSGFIGSGNILAGYTVTWFVFGE